MEVTSSVTLILTQAELLEALREGNAVALFETAREDGVLLDIGSVDMDEAKRILVGPPGVMRQIFPSLVQAETP